MGCSEGTNADLEKEKVGKEENQEDKKENKDEGKKIQENNKENKEKEEEREKDKEKEEEKKNEDELYTYTGINEKDFSLCKKLASKEYDKDTILLYKCIIYVDEDDITYLEYFVVKTLKKEGLAYENKNFEFRSPCVLLGLTPNFCSQIEKEVIINESSCGTEYDKPKFKRYPTIDFACYKIEITQNPEELFAVYFIYSKVQRDNKNGVNRILNAIPFKKSELSNPECYFQIHIHYEDYNLISPDKISNIEFLKNDKELKISGNQELKDEIIFYFRNKNPEKIVISPEDDAFRNFYKPSFYKYMNGIINNIDIKPKIVIAVDEQIRIAAKVALVTLVKTLVDPNIFHVPFDSMNLHTVKETKYLKVTKKASNHKSTNALAFDGNYFFTLPYRVEANEIFTTVRAIFSFSISRTESDLDFIELVNGELCENGVYHLTVRYNPKEYDGVILRRNMMFKEKEDVGIREYYTYYHQSEIGEDGVFNCIYLHNAKKDS